MKKLKLPRKPLSVSMTTYWLGKQKRKNSDQKKGPSTFTRVQMEFPHSLATAVAHRKLKKKRACRRKHGPPSPLPLH